MEPFSITAATYDAIFYSSTTALVLVVIFNLLSDNDSVFHKNNKNVVFTFLFLCALCYFIGFRPHTGFGDTGYYVYSYEHVGSTLSPLSYESEWLWHNMNVIMHSFGIPVTLYLTCVAFVYLLGMFICSYHFNNRNLLLSFLFFICSFSFMGFGVNGARNGMACSVVLIALAILDKKALNIGAFILLSIVALGIHKSIFLPTTIAILCTFFVKETRYAIVFWVVSIFLSLLIGDTMIGFFSNIEFDARLNAYLSETGDIIDVQQRNGFRWDFLLYSLVPIVFVWYLTIKRNFQDRRFNLIANVYILSNAFWVMVNTAEFSNRFAYLSWFIYPLVIVYPLINFNIWEDQKRKTAVILAMYSGFTLFMHFVYY